MRTKIRRSLTFANICSALALFVALSTGTAYAANTVFSTDIVDGEVKRDDLAKNAVNSQKVVNGSLNTDDLAAGSVSSAIIFDATITADDLGAGSVGSLEVATDAIGASEIADNSIDGGEIVNDSLSASDLASGSVANAELGTGAVTTTKVGANAIDGSKVAANSLTSADIAGTDINGLIQVPTGTVAAGRCSNFPIGVGGANAGEAVVITTTAALQNGILIYGSRVPSNGTVTMTFCNLSGTTQAALVDFPIRIMTFG